MSTSVDPRPRLRDGRAVAFAAAPYDSPVARALVEAVQQEYVVRYGGPDDAVVDPAEFAAPLGLFLVATVDGVAAGCAAWRMHAEGTVEIKRMYVAADYRRQGLARLLMDGLEASIISAGHRTVVLNTGDRQPEAIALYAARGYRPVPGYGVYADSPGAVFLGKQLVEPVDENERAEEQPWAS